MMNPRLVEASRKLITLKSWEWMPGMLGVRFCNPDKSDYLKPEVRIQGIRDVETANAFRSIPDLTDPATLGCLLYLVRKASKDPDAYLCNYGGYDSVEWGVCSGVIEDIREELDLSPHGWMRVLLGDASTEGLALALSIEEAEKFYASIKESKSIIGGGRGSN